ncbi:MAG: sulfite exporter TauE/SafE family protein [Bacteriovoracaceae bacterium]|nr:sulfite exporter TauE/SafE family protein [Bacteriovoracaceae bacterium]
MTLIILTIVTFLTSIISAIIGMGGGVLLLSVMTFFLPLHVIIPVHGFVQLISNSTRLLFLKLHIRWRFFTFFAIGMPFGAALSAFLLKDVVSESFPYLAISLLIFYAVFKPKKMPHFEIHSWGWTIVGFFTGIAAILVGAVGPLIAPFFIRKDLEKEEIVATKATMQMISHLSKIPVFLYLDFRFEDYSSMTLLMAFAAIAGTHYGIGILRKVDDSVFKKLYRGVLFISGVRLLYRFIEFYI